MAPETDSGRRGRAAEAALALLIALFALASVVELVPRAVGIDYYLYWATGEAHAHGEIRDVYEPSENVRVGRLYLQHAQEEARALGVPTTRRLEAARVRSE